MRNDRDQKAAMPVERHSEFASPRDRIFSMTDELLMQPIDKILSMIV